MRDLWYRCWHGLCVRVYFDRVRVLWKERLPERGPVLYVALHRNGAVDGFVYAQVIPRSVFVVSAQLLRGAFARLFFHGIAVARNEEEGDMSQNAAALSRCVDLLDNGQELAIFPEGTSSLGPRHLPFKSGAARLAVEAIQRGVPLKIVPLGIHYDRAWAFRSRVEIVVGNCIATDCPAGSSDAEALREMKRRIHAALEAVGVNFTSSEHQEAAEGLSGLAAAVGRDYFSTLKALEPSVPEPLRGHWQELRSSGALRYHGVPRFSRVPLIFQFLQLMLLGPWVLAGMIANIVPLAVGWIAARRFADDLNTIALWRILIGMPVFVIWWCVVIGATALAGNWLWVAAYVLLTSTALVAYHHTIILAVCVWNDLMARNAAPQIREIQEELMKHPQHS